MDLSGGSIQSSSNQDIRSNPIVLISPNLEKLNSKVAAKRLDRRDEGKAASSRYVHYCDSVEDPSLEQANKRFREKEKRVAAEKLWKSIAALGVVGDEKDVVYVEAIKQMEVRDCEGEKHLMAEKNKVGR